MAGDDFNQFLIDFSNFDCFHDSFDSQVDQEKLEELKSLRKQFKWEIEEERKMFFSSFNVLTRGWNVGLPDLREIFRREEIEWLLTRAVEIGFIRFTRFVIKSGYRDEPDLDEDGKPLPRRTTPMHYNTVQPRAQGAKWDTIIRDLFRIYNRFDVNYTDESGLSHFHVACMAGCLYVVKKLFTLVRDPNFLVQETGDSPLHLALRYGKKKVAEWLLRKGAISNLVNAEGLTHFHMACVGVNDDDLAEMLFKFANDKHQPIDINAQDKLGDTPLHLALRKGHDKVAEWLLRKGADPNVANTEGLTPLHVICKRDKDDGLLKKFFETNNEKHKTLQVDVLDKLGWTPLQWAVVSLLPHAVDVLLDHGADLSGFVFPTASHFDERIKSYNTFKIAFRLILASGSLAVVECLENRGYELTRSDALTIMELFAKYKLFKKSENILDGFPDNQLTHQLFLTNEGEAMVIQSLSLYDLTRLRPKDAAKVLTYQDYLEFARSEKLYVDPFKQFLVLYLSEKLSRGFFRVWAMECFMELTQCRLPIECCEMIIDESFLNKNLYDICLAAIGQSL